MSQNLWQFDETRKDFSNYYWYADELPARKFYLFIAEIGRQLRRLMTQPDQIEMIELCEQCGEGKVSENEISDFGDRIRRCGSDPENNLHANSLYWWVPDRYKVASHGVEEFAVEAFAIEAAVNAGVLKPNASFQDIDAVQRHPVFASVRDRTELEWGNLVRCIYGPNPFTPPTFSPSWRSESAVALARTAYDTRNFTLLPILADALEEAGCDHADMLNHCRDPKAIHARGCWVVDLVLGKS